MVQAGVSWIPEMEDGQKYPGRLDRCGVGGRVWEKRKAPPKDKTKHSRVPRAGNEAYQTVWKNFTSWEYWVGYIEEFCLCIINYSPLTKCCSGPYRDKAAPFIMITDQDLKSMEWI